MGLVLVASILFMMFALPTYYVEAQSSGTFPVDGAFNGMTITYSVSGVDLGTPIDTSGFTTSRNYDNAIVTGSTVTISGTVHQENGYGADVTVSLQVGSATDSVSYSGTTPWDQAFSVSVNVPAGAKSGSFSIDMTGSYNAGSRGLIVSGQFPSPTVDHITIVSPKDNVITGDDPFTVTATVYASDNSQVEDGTLVYFSLRDKESGTLAGASIDPPYAYTVNSEVTATFTPPSAQYWDDPLHANYAGQNSITIIATAEGKQAEYEIIILNPSSTTTPTPPTPTPTTTSSSRVTLVSKVVTLNEANPSESWLARLAKGDNVEISAITRTGDGATFEIINSLLAVQLAKQLTTGSGALPTSFNINGLPVQEITIKTIEAGQTFYWTVPSDDTYQFKIEKIGDESIIDLTIITETSQADVNSYLPIVIAAVIVAVVVVVAVSVLVLRRKNRPKISRLQEASPPPPPPPPPPT